VLPIDLMASGLCASVKVRVIRPSTLVGATIEITLRTRHPGISPGTHSLSRSIPRNTYIRQSCGRTCPGWSSRRGKGCQLSRCPSRPLLLYHRSLSRPQSRYRGRHHPDSASTSSPVQTTLSVAFPPRQAPRPMTSHTRTLKMWHDPTTYSASRSRYRNGKD